jgi:hypothetical protein
MAWTKITRPHYRRDGMRYESDTTDAEWFLIEPLLPLASALGRPRATDELCRNLGDEARSGGVVCRHFEDLDAVFESDTCDKLRQVICAF